MDEFLALNWGRAYLVLLVTVCCAALELVLPYERDQGPWARLRGLIYWMFFIPGSALAYVSISAFVQYFDLRPALSLDLAQFTRSDDWRLVVLAYMALPLPVMIADFCFYWFHRLQHRVPLLWRFHAVHHAIEEMNAANSANHPTEGLFHVIFLLPLALLIHMTVPQVLIVTILFSTWGQIVHANTRLSIGPLKYVISWPLFHRVHHSVDRLHHNKNFGSTFSLWDVIFRTAYFPRKDEVLRTGLVDRREPKTLWQYFVQLAPR